MDFILPLSIVIGLTIAYVADRITEILMAKYKNKTKKVSDKK